MRYERLARLALLLLMVFLFLTAIELFGHSFKLAGRETAESLFHGLDNPFAGLAVGILATVMVQSSSVTTSTVVALVGAGALSLDHAVPVVMGANIGTSITNTLVALGHWRSDSAFERAFAGATVHDIFNLLTTLILFPIELATHFLRRTARWMVSVLPLAETGGGFHSPIKSAVKWAASLLERFLQSVFRLEGGALAVVLCLCALLLIVTALLVIVKNMQLLTADRIEEWLNRVLGRSGLLGLAIGIVITVLVQSSSITTSLLVPMFGAGVLKIEAGFPIMLGANIGTTVTALLASSVTGSAGLTIAVVHLLFNVVGTLIFFPLQFMRRAPIILAEGLAALAIRNRLWVVAYILAVFVAAPLLGILIWK